MKQLPACPRCWTVVAEGIGMPVDSTRVEAMGAKKLTMNEGH
jgi:hypothetical protein